MTRFAFFLVDQFSLFNLAAFLDPLRAANQMGSEEEKYEWLTCNLHGAPSRCSSNTRFNVDCAVSELPPCDVFIICAGFETDPDDVGLIHKALQYQEKAGAHLGALSTGSIILASGGFLDGYRCTIHWEYQEGFKIRFPHVNCTGSVFEIDRNRITSSGGTASLDLALNIIARDFSPDTARKVANQFQHERIRKAGDPQRAGKTRDLSKPPEKLARIMQLMQSNLEYPLSTLQLADEVCLSVRQIERLFLKYLGCTPGKYYKSLRLERSRELLRQTNTPIVDVALAAGFSSHPSFAQSYRNYFKRSPSEERRVPIAGG